MTSGAEKTSNNVEFETWELRGKVEENTAEISSVAGFPGFCFS